MSLRPCSHRSRAHTHKHKRANAIYKYTGSMRRLRWCWKHSHRVRHQYISIHSVECWCSSTRLMRLKLSCDGWTHSYEFRVPNENILLSPIVLRYINGPIWENIHSSQRRSMVCIFFFFFFVFALNQYSQVCGTSDVVKRVCAIQELPV